MIVPVFAVERTQEILDDIARLKQDHELPNATIFLDSPLAGRVTEVFYQHRQALEGKEAHRFKAGGFRTVETVEQSKAISRIHGGAIVLAGSGMCEAGRVKHHLKDHLWRPDSTVLFVGYQAPGTLGAIIRGGASTVRIHGEEVNVKARIRSIDAYSGHADRDELVQWARPTFEALGTALLVHGEPEATRGLATALASAGLEASRILTPQLDETFDIVFRKGLWEAVPAMAPRAPRLEADQATATHDWHNDYAALLLDLRNALRREVDDGRRHKLLAEVRRLIEAPGGRGRAERGSSGYPT